MLRADLPESDEAQIAIHVAETQTCRIKPRCPVSMRPPCRDVRNDESARERQGRVAGETCAMVPDAHVRFQAGRRLTSQGHADFQPAIRSRDGWAGIDTDDLERRDLKFTLHWPPRSDRLHART